MEVRWVGTQEYLRLIGKNKSKSLLQESKTSYGQLWQRALSKFEGHTGDLRLKCVGK